MKMDKPRVFVADSEDNRNARLPEWFGNPRRWQTKPEFREVYNTATRQLSLVDAVPVPPLAEPDATKARVKGKLTPITSTTARRKVLGDWRVTAPANDSTIFGRAPRASKSPRHADLAEECKELLVWRSFREPLVNNWLAPDNDNERYEDENGESRPVPKLVECELETRPGIGPKRKGEQSELERAYSQGVTYKELQHAKLGGGGAPYVVPLSGKVKLSPIYEPDGKPYLNDRKQSFLTITRLGNCEFSNIRHIEVEKRHRKRKDVPTLGEMTHWKSREVKDDFGTPYGYARNVEEANVSNVHFAMLLGTGTHRYLKRGDEVPADDGKAALPCGSPYAADAFLGCVSTPSGPPKIDYSAGVDDVLATRQEVALICDKLSCKTVKILDKAIACASLGKLANAFGYSKASGYSAREAMRKGKTLLLEAVQEVRESLI
jgi:hypothetical protein